jgi:hypothetical protein
MDIVDPNAPLYNAIIFYILIVGVLLIVKPNFMYCDKTNKFKPFGFEEGKTLVCFPTVAICMAVLLYIIFISINIVHNIRT